MTYPEFRNLVLSWELPETWAKRIWGRWQHILTKVTPADVEHAWRDTMRQIAAEAKHNAN